MDLSKENPYTFMFTVEMESTMPLLRITKTKKSAKSPERLTLETLDNEEGLPTRTIECDPRVLDDLISQLVEIQKYVTPAMPSWEKEK